ncbi:MAG: OadG family protein [Clostridiales bacterium]|nr:OadG family protein [Clostridiales bacterium]
MNTLNYFPFLTASLGERMIEAGLNTLIGMAIVLVVLIFIAFVIYLFKYLPGSPDNVAKKGKTPKQSQVNKPVSTSTGINDTGNKDLTPSNDSVLVANDSELVAVITAAIMASMEEEGSYVPADGLLIRSIRRKTTYKK